MDSELKEQQRQPVKQQPTDHSPNNEDPTSNNAPQPQPKPPSRAPSTRYNNPPQQQSPSHKHLQQMWNNISNQRLKHITSQMLEHRNSIIRNQLSSTQIPLKSIVFDSHYSQSLQLRKRSQPLKPDPEKLKERKETVLRMLQAIEVEEERIKKEERNKKSASNSPQKLEKMQKSELTEEESARIKEVWKSHRRLQLRLKRRQQQLKAAQLAELQHQQRLTEQQQQQRKSQRRQQIALKLQQLSKRRQQRQHLNKLTDLQLKQQLQKHYLDNQLQQRFLKRQAQQRRLLQQRRLIKKKALDVHISDLKQHEKRYDEQMARMCEERERKIKEFRKMFASDNSTRYEDTHFAMILKEEEMKARKKEQQEREYRTGWKERVNTYVAEVREKHLPRIREKTEMAEKHEETNGNTTIAEVKSLSVEEFNKLGNQYLRVAKSLAKKRESAPQQPPLVTSPQRNKQPDYLRSFRIKSQQSHHQYGDLHRLKKILRDKQPSFQTIQEARMLVEKMDGVVGNTNDTRLLTVSINAKLSILNTIL